MQMGLVHPGTNLGIVWQMIGSLKTVPPRMFRMVPEKLSWYIMSAFCTQI